ncbi:dihydroxyacetone kinase subunit L [Actinocatenispora thailandica]|uniref:Dihydroxyacetone kinase subunit L n=1 Tax=Actinocatenispora thailandica TaxID=227318 RepID=A0A7R7DPG7_9ACTN|nr:dihydroxyacetone kinase subunit DhaL [Actinocatenispora thailandica]BCJ35281.1 dihydroxyacetone kinase subunit L [Actinocatenispora thailandica]
MADRLSATDLTAVFADFQRAVERDRDLLTELDTAVGDGDHGTNLDRGMRAAVEALAAIPQDTPGGVFNLVGRRLVSTVGGASGALYGTAFLRAARAAGAAEALDAATCTAVLRDATTGIAERGKCATGDKTMYDVWMAASTAAAAAAGDGLPALLAAASTAAGAAEQEMVPWQARRGRASYLGERSKDHRDPGAVSSRLLFGCFAAWADA